MAVGLAATRRSATARASEGVPGGTAAALLHCRRYGITDCRAPSQSLTTPYVHTYMRGGHCTHSSRRENTPYDGRPASPYAFIQLPSVHTRFHVERVAQQRARAWRNKAAHDRRWPIRHPTSCASELPARLHGYADRPRRGRGGGGCSQAPNDSRRNFQYARPRGGSVGTDILSAALPVRLIHRGRSTPVAPRLPLHRCILSCRSLSYSHEECFQPSIWRGQGDGRIIL